MAQNPMAVPHQAISPPQTPAESAAGAPYHMLRIDACNALAHSATLAVLRMRSP